MLKPEHDLTTLRCHNCANVDPRENKWCASCASTRTIFWVNGRSYPYTPEGEKRARAALHIHQRDAALAPEGK
jgi:hypothetical protein